MNFKDLTFSWHIGIGYSGVNHKDTVKVSDYFTEEGGMRCLKKILVSG